MNEITGEQVMDLLMLGKEIQGLKDKSHGPVEVTTEVPKIESLTKNQLSIMGGLSSDLSGMKSQINTSSLKPEWHSSKAKLVTLMQDCGVKFTSDKFGSYSESKIFNFLEDLGVLSETEMIVTRSVMSGEKTRVCRSTILSISIDQDPARPFDIEVHASFDAAGILAVYSWADAQDLEPIIEDEEHEERGLEHSDLYLGKGGDVLEALSGD